MRFLHVFCLGLDLVFLSLSIVRIGKWSLRSESIIREWVRLGSKSLRQTKSIKE